MSDDPRSRCTVDDAFDYGAKRSGIEWPTLLLAIGIYAAWLLITAFHAIVPFWLLAVVGGVIIA